MHHYDAESRHRKPVHPGGSRSGGYAPAQPGRHLWDRVPDLDVHHHGGGDPDLDGAHRATPHDAEGDPGARQALRQQVQVPHGGVRLWLHRAVGSGARVAHHAEGVQKKVRRDHRGRPAVGGEGGRRQACEPERAGRRERCLADGMRVCESVVAAWVVMDPGCVAGNPVSGFGFGG